MNRVYLNFKRRFVIPFTVSALISGNNSFILDIIDYEGLSNDKRWRFKNYGLIFSVFYALVSPFFYLPSASEFAQSGALVIIIGLVSFMFDRRWSEKFERELMQDDQSWREAYLMQELKLMNERLDATFDFDRDITNQLFKASRLEGQPLKAQMARIRAKKKRFAEMNISENHEFYKFAKEYNRSREYIREELQKISEYRAKIFYIEASIVLYGTFVWGFGEDIYQLIYPERGQRILSIIDWT